MHKIEAIRMYSMLMQELIKEHAQEARLFVKDMLNEDSGEMEEMNAKRFAAMVANTTIEFLAQDLDVDYGNPDVVPKVLQEAIKRFVLDNMKVEFDWVS